MGDLVFERQGRAAQYARGTRGLAVRLGPGLVLAVTIAAAARFAALSAPLPAVFFALGLGILCSSFAQTPETKPGIAFAARPLLQIGVALLGLQISVHQFVALGSANLAITLLALFATLSVGTLIGCLARMSARYSFLAAASVAVCGASAALAVAAALPKSEQREAETATVIASITVVGSLAMLVYPFMGQAFDLGSIQMAVFLGGSLHEVVQAIGAGFAVSDEVGESSTIVKLVRVACLPIVVALAATLPWQSAGSATSQKPTVPAFLIGFVALAVVAAALPVPDLLKSAAAEASRWCLLISIAALGIRTSPGKLMAAGWGPATAITLTSVFLAGVILIALKWA